MSVREQERSTLNSVKGGIGLDTRSLMGFEPTVRTMWHSSWMRNTVTRRETMMGEIYC